jgi:hypothetical protein
MLAIRDRFVLGALAGMVGTIPSLILNFFSVQLGLAKFYSFQISGSIYLFPGLTDSVAGMVLGALIWISFGAFLGVVIVYLLTYTGHDYWWLKGPLVAFVIMFVGIYGIMYTSGAARIVPFDLATNLSEAVGNLVFGFFTAYLVVRWNARVRS